MTQNEQFPDTSPSDAIAGYLVILVKSFGGTLDHAANAVLGPSSTTCEQGPTEPQPYEVVQNFISKTLAEMTDLINNRPRFAHGSPGDDLHGIGKAALTPEVKEAWRQALSDSTQTGNALDSIERLNHEFGRNIYVNEAARGTLHDLLYEGDTTALRSAATNPDAELSGRIQDLIVNTYHCEERPVPEMTAFVVEHHRRLLGRHRHVLAQREPGVIFFRGPPDPDIAAMFARAIAEAPKDDMLALINSLSEGAGETSYSNQRLVNKIYEAALGLLVTHPSYPRQFLDKLGLGLDVERVATTWTESEGISTSIKTMMELETIRPGACKTLNKILGISGFGRYSIDMLLDAHDAINNPPRSYVLVTTPQADWNGAFQSGLLDRLRNRLQALNPDIRLIPTELSSLRDIWHTARTLRSKGWGAADHLIFGAHGTPTASHLGKDWISTESTGSAEGSWHALSVLLQNIIKKDGTILMKSCSTGHGITSLAAHIANHSGRVTFAPDEELAVKTIRSKTDPVTGKILLEISYVTSRTQDPRPTLKFTPGNPIPERVNYPEDELWQPRSDR